MTIARAFKNGRSTLSDRLTRGGQPNRYRGLGTRERGQRVAFGLAAHLVLAAYWSIFRASVVAGSVGLNFLSKRIPCMVAGAP